MTTYRIVAEDAPAASDIEIIEQGLEAYNRSQTGRDDARFTKRLDAPGSDSASG